MKRWMPTLTHRRCTRAVLLLTLAEAGCSEADAQKSWSALSTCLAGPAASGALAPRVAQLRLIQLANPPASATKPAWPARCGSAADDLYAALGTSSEGASLKRKLHERFACADDKKGSCAPPSDSGLISAATELWEAANSAGLKNEASSTVAQPQAAPPPLVNADGWKSFSDKSLVLVGPQLTSSGGAQLLLKAREGRSRPRGCELAPTFSKILCFNAAPEVPELPVQSIDLVRDSSGVFAAGLTDDGLFGYELKTGQKSDVRGLGPLRLVRDGLAVERGDKDQGFQVTLLANGKAGKALKLPMTLPVADPIAVGTQVVYLQQVEAGTQWVSKTVSAGRLKEVASATGEFSGPLHGCRRNGDLAVAAFGARAGQHNAKPTTSDGKTRVSVSLFQGGAWSKPSSVSIPFDRNIESDLVCTQRGASLSYAKPGAGGIEVGRVDCDSNGCKVDAVTLPGAESKWFWAVGPLNDKTLLMWRSNFGETRLRIAPLSGLASAKDVIAFDAPDFGGPNAGELSALFADDDALLLFRGEAPVAAHVSALGTLRVVVP